MGKIAYLRGDLLIKCVIVQRQVLCGLKRKRIAFALAHMPGILNGVILSVRHKTNNAYQDFQIHQLSLGVPDGSCFR